MQFFERKYSTLFRVRKVCKFGLVFSFLIFLTSACFVSPPQDTRYWKCEEDNDCVSYNCAGCNYFCFKKFCVAPCTDDTDCQKARGEVCIKGPNVCLPCNPGSKRKCYGGHPSFRGKGICNEGEQTCGEDFKWSKCDGWGAPKREVCNKKDDNCDGKVDEGCGCNPGDKRSCYSGPAKTAGKGPCKPGQQTCSSSGQWTGAKCVGEVVPASSDKCNNIDDDCDGLVDEDVVSQQACKIAGQKGECANGLSLCENGKFSCRQIFTARQLEECDGKDDDCDGKIDNLPGLGDHTLARSCFTSLTGCQYDATKKEHVCKGSCKGGTQRCLKQGIWASSCSGQQLPTEDKCNGIDDNCDGTVDNNAKCPKGTTCKNGSCR